MRSRSKPDWVRKAVLSLAIHLPDASCRTLAAEFNRQHPSFSVGKTWVADLLLEHAYSHLHRRQLLKKKPPKTVGRQVFWGLDLCFCTDGNGQTHAVLGLCEHQSRRALVLQRLPNKNVSHAIGLGESRRAAVRATAAAVNR